MGYDSRIYIVNKRSGPTWPRFNGKVMCEVLGVVEMCVCDQEFRALFDRVTDCRLFSLDGPIIGDDLLLETDCYNDPLKEADLLPVMAYLRKRQHGPEPYRRYGMLLALLESLQGDDWQDCDLALIHYGH